MSFDRMAANKFLVTLDDALRAICVPYFLIQGTALGAYRDADFPPYERDINVGILLPPHRSLTMINALCCLAASGFEVTTWNRHKQDGSVHTIVAQQWGIHADIVGWTRWKDKRYAQSPADVSPPYCIVHDAGQIEVWQKVVMFGREFNVPSPIERYLKLEYGPDWRTPKDDHVSRTRVYDFLKREDIE